MPIAQFQLGHGGAEMQAHRLARALVARGHQVEIVTSRHAGEARLEAIDGGVTVRRLFTFDNRRAVWRLGAYSYTGLLLAELLGRRSGHDVVHVHQAFHPAFAAVLARRLGGGRPVVVKVATAGSFGDLNQMREGRPTLPLGSARMARAIVRGADMLVAISAAVAGELAAAGVPAARIARIPNGVDVHPVPTPADRAAARSALNVPPGSKVLVYVGRSGPQKGSDVLLAAWRCLRGRMGGDAAAGARLFVLGQGFDSDAGFMATAREMGPSVTVAGRVGDVPKYLAASDLFVLPSRGEGLSNAILEAMMYGVPCLVSDIQPNLELVEHGRTGLVFPSEDGTALARAIEDALSRPAETAGLALEARRLVEDRYAMPRVVSDYEALYSRLIGASQPPHT